MMDPRLVSLLGDKRFKCFVNLLKGKECSMLDIDPERRSEEHTSELQSR